MQRTPEGPIRVGLIGRGITLSRTPAMHMAEARAQGFEYDYSLFDLDEPSLADKPLKTLLDELEQAGFAGVNVTFPYKIEVLPLLHDLSPNAAAVGAVNTVVFREGRRIGHNTDLWGFAESFRQGLADAKAAHVLLSGAGGAGVAVAHALADCGAARLSIFDLDLERATALARQVEKNRPEVTARAVTDLADLMAQDTPDGVVNATPMGMAKLPGSSVPTALLTPGMWLADIVYFPLETELLRAATDLGCRILPGSGMAVFQAVRAFELFTGRAADPDRMKATFDAFGSEEPRDSVKT